MWLKFIRYGAKFYAEMPQGELQFGDATGLNEWFCGRRIHYTDGDRQAAVNGQMLQLHTDPMTYYRAWSVAIARYKFETN